MLESWASTWAEAKDRIEAPAWASDPSGPVVMLLLWLVVLGLWKYVVAHLD